MSWWTTLKRMWRADPDPSPEQLLDAAKQEMKEMHARNRERAVQAITQKNNLQQMADDLQKQVDDLDAKANAAEAAGDMDSWRRFTHQRSDYEKSLHTARESLAGAIETAEAVKAHIKREEELIRRKTAEALQLKAQWRETPIQKDMEKELQEAGFPAGPSMPLRHVRAIVRALLGLIVLLVALVVLLLSR